jgi:hypothetical protein
MCVCSCGAQEYNHRMLQLMQIKFEFALVAASHGYILGVHMTKHTLLNNVMLLRRSHVIFQLEVPNRVLKTHLRDHMLLTLVLFN